MNAAYITTHAFAIPDLRKIGLIGTRFLRLVLQSSNFCGFAGVPFWTLCSLFPTKGVWQEPCSVFTHCSVGEHQELLKPRCSKYSRAFVMETALIFLNLRVRNGMAELQGRRYLHVEHAHRSCIYIYSVYLFQAGGWVHCRFLQ